MTGGRLADGWLTLASLTLILTAILPAPRLLQAQERGRGLDTGWSLSRCLAVTTDRDADGLDDGCETALARSFAPVLLVDRDDCLWEEAQAGLLGGYLYAVSRAADRIRIAYLPAYLRDCGWRGWPRALRLGRRNAHDGDSELIVVEVRPEAGERWRTAAVYLSAHCGGQSAGRCRWFRDADLEQLAWHEGTALGAPIVWVARDKHANYPSRASCESGHWRQERCARAPATLRFPIENSDRNLGNARHPHPRARGCILGSELALRHHVSAAAVECLWDDSEDFGGWQPRVERRGATPYAIVLRRADVDPD